VIVLGLGPADWVAVALAVAIIADVAVWRARAEARRGP
jgi:hypothetical protein